MAAELGHRVLLQAPVERIEHDDAAVVVRSANFSMRAQRTIVAIPPTLAGRIRYAPALDGLRDQLTPRLPMGPGLKRPAERGGGKEWVRTCKCRGSTTY